MTIALDHRIKVLIGTVVMVLIVLSGWILGIAPQLTAVSVAEAQIATVLAANDRAQTKLKTLAAEADELPDLRAQLSVLTASVPSSADSSALLTQINAIAASSGVVVDGVALDSATAYLPPTAADTAAATGGATVTSDAVYSDPRITSSNFIVIPVTINITGSNDGVQSFLAGLQSGSRLFLVSTYSSTSEASSADPDGAVSAVVGGFVYVLVDESTITTAPVATSAG